MRWSSLSRGDKAAVLVAAALVVALSAYATALVDNSTRQEPVPVLLELRPALQ